MFTQDKELPSIDKPGQHPRELNPFWREGGSGLPGEKGHPVKSSKSSIGDGGRSWILRSYKRALEQAEAENTSLEDIAIKRWGSLEKLHALLRSAGIDPSDPDNCSPKKYLYSSHSSDKRRRNDDDDKRMSHSHSRQPSSRKPESKKGVFLRPGESNDKPTMMDNTKTQSWQIPSRADEKVSSLKEFAGTKTGKNDDEVKGGGSSLSSEESSSQPVTDAQLNALGAKLVKAELMGDKGKIEKLKCEMDRLRKRKTMQENQHRGERKEVHVKETVVLTTTDRFDRERPFELSHVTRPGLDSRMSHSKKGKRERYFANDDNFSLQDLIKQERNMTSDETLASISNMAAKFVPASNSGETVDDVLDSKISMKYDESKEQARQKQKAIFESRVMAEILSNCHYCFDTPNFSKHLLIAVGIGVYLAVPSHQSITDGHCFLVPIEHTTCSLQMDENVWSEVRVFQKGLTRMFADRDMDIIFTETYSHSKRKAHMYIECIPLPKDEGSLAPMYFKKAILESDEEWAQNKKLIDTRSKDVRKCVPAGLPYFFVDFGLDGGYAHVIEDTSKFPHYFAKEVIGGLLDVEPRLWLKPPRDNVENQKSKALKLSTWWKPYDWTEKLKS